MGFNILDLITKLKDFSKFKNQILSSGQDPRQLLETELKKRNITPEQLRELVNVAKQINKYIK